MTKFDDWPRWLQIAHGLLLVVLFYFFWPKTTKQVIWFLGLTLYVLIVYLVFMR